MGDWRDDTGDAWQMNTSIDAVHLIAIRTTQVTQADCAVLNIQMSLATIGHSTLNACVQYCHIRSDCCLSWNYSKQTNISACP